MISDRAKVYLKKLRRTGEEIYLGVDRAKIHGLVRELNRMAS